MKYLSVLLLACILGVLLGNAFNDAARDVNKRAVCKAGRVML